MKKIETLCMVDDDDVYVFLASKAVEQTKLVNEIKIFSNGADALTFLKNATSDPSQLPEIILLDLSMPVMDGWDFLEEFIQLKPKLNKKIVLYVVSSSIAPSDFERAKAIETVSDYIIKPTSQEKFIDLFQSYRT